MNRYVKFESLLMTGRAVIRRGNWVRIHTAGDEPVCYWLQFDDKRTAKLAGRSVLANIREKRGAGTCNDDVTYNAYLFDWVEQLRLGGYVKNLREMEAQ